MWVLLGCFGCFGVLCCWVLIDGLGGCLFVCGRLFTCYLVGVGLVVDICCLGVVVLRVVWVGLIGC